ncbi:NXPE family member 4-like isoform X2 [Mixophyes fleayi]|uniref:NXPE family member 4-like isoform X2 n=1 Tax=Mixophyes fleayi TaxID=3061075 RepID=UPI003F4DF303
MPTTWNHKTFLAVTMITVMLISFMVHRFTEIKFIIVYSHKPTETQVESHVTVASSLAEDELQSISIFDTMSAKIPNLTFTHFNKSTSARNCRAIIINPKEKYCVGDILSVRIDMFDYLGNKKTYGGDFIKARIFTPSLNAGASGRVEDFNNGSYHVHFTLFWEGRVYISLILYHPSEGVSALWKARNQDYGLICFSGTFVNGSQQVKSECGFKLNSEKKLCEYGNEEDNESFYCNKPASFNCKSLIYVQQVNSDLSFFRELEKPLFKRENIGVEIPTNFKDIDVSICTVPSPSHFGQCKIGMESPFPSGFVWHNNWRPVFCDICNFTTHEQMYACLNNKMIYLMGDSTLKQWFKHLLQTFKGLRNLPLYRTGLESMMMAVDQERNIKLQWKKHSHPFVATHFYLVKDDAYINEQIDRLAGGPHYVIVISLGQHFRPFPINLFIRRLINVQKAVKRLFIRSPETKVIIKAENTREISRDTERFSDFHGYIQYLIVKDIFRDLRVAVVDAWDMTIAYNTNDIHPHENVVKNQIDMFLTYIC